MHGSHTQRYGILTAALAAALALPAAAHAEASFGGAVSYGAGTAPSSVAVGDFNGDGHPDLAVANAASGDVSILAGDAAGTLTPAGSVPVGGGLVAVAVGDFNRDGDPDLAIATLNGDGSVAIALGGAGASFGPVSFVPAGFQPVAIAVGDWDRDGDLDLAVANQGSGSVSILLGNGDGSFASSGSDPASGAPAGIAAGDFDGDGIADLAVADGFGSSVASILPGRDAGRFGERVNVSAGDSPTGIAVGDFNGDGDKDLAVTNASAGTVSILLGGAGDSFGAPVSYPAGDLPGSLAVADFDGDGHADLAVTGGRQINRQARQAVAANGAVSVLSGVGDGTFGAAKSFTAGDVPVALAAGDFNGDAQPDLAVANSSSNDVSVLLNLHKAVVTTPPVAQGVVRRETNVVPLLCSRAVAITGIGVSGKYVNLAGIARVGYAGQRVQIRAGKHLVATATVGRDGRFSTRAVRPAARTAANIRYRAVVAGHSSAALRLLRLVTMRARHVGGRVEVSGRVAGVHRRVTLRIVRQTGCSAASVKRVGEVRTTRNGSFSVTLPKAAAGSLTIYRVVAAKPHTFTLPILVG